MNIRPIANSVSFLILSSALVLSACGGGGGGGGGKDTKESNAAPIGDISGTWNVIENIDGTQCGEGKYVEKNIRWIQHNQGTR